MMVGDFILLLKVLWLKVKYTVWYIYCHLMVIKQTANVYILIFLSYLDLKSSLFLQRRFLKVHLLCWSINESASKSNFLRKVDTRSTSYHDVRLISSVKRLVLSSSDLLLSAFRNPPCDYRFPSCRSAQQEEPSNQTPLRTAPRLTRGSLRNVILAVPHVIVYSEAT